MLPGMHGSLMSRLVARLVVNPCSRMETSLSVRPDSSVIASMRNRPGGSSLVCVGGLRVRPDSLVSCPIASLSVRPDCSLIAGLITCLSVRSGSSLIMDLSRRPDRSLIMIMDLSVRPGNSVTSLSRRPVSLVTSLDVLPYVHPG